MDCVRQKNMIKALQTFRAGGFVMVMDSDEREDECDLIIAAEKCTEEQMAFMIKHSTGIVCVVAEKQLLERMQLHPATGNNTDRNATNFYVSTDYLVGTSTGVSAADRVATIKAMCEDNIKPEEFSKPGHMFPLCAREGGVLEREGHTESAYDLCRLTGMKKVSAIGELMHENGKMYRLQDSKEFAKKHNIPLITVDDIIVARKDEEAVKQQLASAEDKQWTTVELMERGTSPLIIETHPHHSNKPPRSGDISECGIQMSDITSNCNLRVYRQMDGEVVVIIKGDVSSQRDVPTRIHSECFTGDTLGSLRCDCGAQLNKFKEIMNKEERALLIYHRGHEGRGIGLWNKIAAYKLQTEEKLDTVDANHRLGFEDDLRSFDGIIEILKDLNVQTIKLYTNNPVKIQGMGHFVSSVETLVTEPHPENIAYLSCKVDRMGHSSELSSFNVPAPPTNNIKIGIVYTMWNEYYVNKMLESAKGALKAKGVEFFTIQVPGAVDLVAGCRKIIKKDEADGILAIGVIIRGTSDQYEFTCSSTLNNIQHLNATFDVPITPMLLMCPDESTASKLLETRNPGAKSADAVIYMASLCKNDIPRIVM